MKLPGSPVSRIILVRGAQAALLALVAHLLLRWPLTGPEALGLFFTPLLSAYFLFVFVAPWSWGLPILTRLPTRRRRVALTFDDGPSPQTTPALLECLKRHGATATFFVLGEAVERRPDLLRRIVADGHTVGVHGYQHRELVLASWAEAGAQIRRTIVAIRHACPDAPPIRWFRPPFGFKTLALPFLARRAGCRLVTWTVDPRDYDRKEPERITRAVLARLRPGAIVLLHDGPACAATADALPHLLAELKKAGYLCTGLGNSSEESRVGKFGNVKY